MTKVCIRCGKNKELDLFYKHPQMADGHLNKCIECCKADAKIYSKSERAINYDRNRPNKAERTEKNKLRMKMLKLENPTKYFAIKNKAQNNYWKNHPEKYIAHKLFSEAIRTGKIKSPGICWICDKECKVEAHHFDYSKPYDVIWMCSECHHKMHKNTRLIREYYKKKESA